jgi:tRNA pseudouridine32 synthase/23S rRNA pseudouridine746 synthase
MVTCFDPQPTASQLPPVMPSPFAAGLPHPLARRAAEALLDRLQRAGGLSVSALQDLERGKMMGVMVVADAGGQVGYLSGFSGMLGGRWEVDGFVGPLFDVAERASFWPAAEEELQGYEARLRAMDDGGDDGELAGRERQRTALRAHRLARSRELCEQLWAGYRIVNARGETRSLRQLFGGRPPGGAGDCAAPKLLGHALLRGLRPLALAEVWWGAAPVSGERHAGGYYPACRGKCGPLLDHMLNGIPVEPAPSTLASGIADHQPEVVHEDRWLLVVNKPVGLASVPGPGEHLSDSVLTRLRARDPESNHLTVVHRLDLDTSGLLLLARDGETAAALQRQFLRREIHRPHAAWLDGAVAGDAGQIELPLRADPDCRPRHIHDPVHGRPAVTTWRVLSRQDARTLVSLEPRTGRAHQLRVHASHPLGLDAPISGDRLYGRGSPVAGERLLLHAGGLRFLHPRTGQPLELHRPAPF